MKIYKYWHLCLAMLLNIGYISCAQNQAISELKKDEKLIEFTTDRFTLPNLHVTPDGKNIIFDVLGDIYLVPIEGGKAEVLLQDNNWKRAGKLSPDGKTLAYVSDETGVFQVWTMELDSKEKRVYPIEEYIHYPLSAYWRDKNRLLIPTDKGLQSFDVVTGKSELIRPLKPEEKNIMKTVSRKMTVNKTATHVFFQFDEALWAYDIKENLDKYIGEINEYRNKTLFNATPDGNKVLYYTTSKTDYSKLGLNVWDLETNSIQCLQTTNDLGSSTNQDYNFDFIDNTTIILDKEGKIVRMDIETGEYETIPIEVEVKKVIKKSLRREPQYIRDSIITASVLRNPITKKDLDTIYFGAFGKLHSYAKQTQEITEIYPKEDRFEVSPSLSPDRRFLAYTTWNDAEMGHIYVRELKTGKEYQLTQTPGRYINPAWSPDGTKIVFVADETEAKLGIPKQSGGPNSLNYHLDIHKMKVFKSNEVQELSQTDTIYRVQSVIQLSRRFYPIPMFHPNGKSIYILAANKEKNFPILTSINLKNKNKIKEYPIPFHIDEVLVSPNAEHIAFIFDEQVWIDTFPHTLKLEFSEGSKYVDKEYHYKGGVVNNILLPQAKSVYEIAPSYLYWQDKYTLMWGSAEEVYTYDVRTGETEKIAEIKVQKPRNIPKTQYALTNARIITMNKQDEIIERGTILVKNNRIETVGEKVKIPEDYKVFDLEGKTIMPGLIDVHAHYHHFPYEFQVQQNYKYIGNLAYGVTTIYDPSVNVLDYREQAQMVETGQIIGPRVFASGSIIMSYPTKYDFKTIHNNMDANRLVNSLIKLNVHGPIKEYGFQNSLKRKRLKEASADNNIGITSHHTTFLEAISRIINGYSAIEHEIGSFPLQNDIIQLIGQSGIYYTPTFMVSPGVYNLYVDETQKEENKLSELNGDIVYRNYYSKHYVDIDESERAIYENKNNMGMKLQVRTIKTLDKIVDSGVKISVGGHGNPLPGIGTHWELWFMTRGMSNYKALQAATINGAKKLDLQDEIGSIETNKLVDIVILNNNPLIDIYNTTDLYFIIQNGNIYDSVTMRKIYPIEE